MTMPHLMNCEHQSEGWCLDCVRKLKDELEHDESKLTKEYTYRAIAASKRICCHLGFGFVEDPHVTRLVLSVVGMSFPNVPRQK